MKTKTPKRTEDVEAVLEVLDIEISYAGEREISAHCPFHADRHPSFSINAKTGLWVCFQCSERGTLETLIRKVKEGVDPVSLLRPLRRQSIGKRGPLAVEVPEKPAIDPLLVAAEYDSFKSPPTWALQGRALDIETSDRYGIRWNKGWVIPVWSPDLDPIFWGWQFKRMEYVRNYPPGIKKAKTLFGLRETDATTAILVESPLDVVRMASVGITGGVASFGAMVSNTQLALLKERFDRIVVALDNDREGKAQGKKIHRSLNRVLPTEFFKYKDDVKDPGDMSDQQLERAFGVYR